MNREHKIVAAVYPSLWLTVFLLGGVSLNSAILANLSLVGFNLAWTAFNVLRFLRWRRR